MKTVLQLTLSTRSCGDVTPLFLTVMPLTKLCSLWAHVQSMLLMTVSASSRTPVCTCLDQIRQA